MQIKLTREEYKNLIEFLLRSTMNGKEAIIFSKLLGSLNQSALGIGKDDDVDEKTK